MSLDAGRPSWGSLCGIFSSEGISTGKLREGLHRNSYDSADEARWCCEKLVGELEERRGRDKVVGTRVFWEG